MNESEVAESEKKSVFNEHPTFLLSVGLLYVTTLGYFSSSTLLNYFNIRATDYFTLEDFVLSAIRDLDLLLYLFIGFISAFFMFFRYQFKFNNQKLKLSGIYKELKKVDKIEELTKEQAEEYLVESKKAHAEYEIWGGYYRKAKNYKYIGFFVFLILSVMAARSTANFKYLDIINFSPEYVRVTLKGSVNEALDINDKYSLILRTSNHTFLLVNKTRGDEKESAVVLKNSNILSVSYVEMENPNHNKQFKSDS